VVNKTQHSGRTMVSYLYSPEAVATHRSLFARGGGADRAVLDRYKQNMNLQVIGIKLAATKFDDFAQDDYIEVKTAR
jgi:hypothetical protein